VSERIYYYEGGYKYQLALDYALQTRILPPATIHHDYFMLDKSGYLVIRKGYAWDGASGPTIDTNDSMRAALVHDCLYQMIGHKLLPVSYREQADYLFYDILREDGMVDFRAWAWLRAVRAFGHGPAVADEKPMKVAPMPNEYKYPSEAKFGRA
jgi:hypothetical protein